MQRFIDQNGILQGGSVSNFRGNHTYHLFEEVPPSGPSGTHCFFYKQPLYKQLGLRLFENNNRIQWSIVMLNNGEQKKF